ncbi:MAG: glutamate--tRNA ligase [Betaproteobacteria bacterium]
MNTASSGAVRTRFAPSPTGRLHLGNIRTAVFAWAYARRHQGQFILRIEDTDLARSTGEYKESILRDMEWLGLDYDEGPVYQMARMPRYRAVLEQFLAEGKAYRCYMTTVELDALRAEQMARGEKPRYDGRWRPENVQGRVPPAGVDPVIRFRNPDDGVVAWDDAVKGRIEFANAELDDLVLARPDGTPTYNFCVVVDDFDMDITHVIRGDDHVNNTPRQINLFHALGAPLPIFGHTPTVLGTDGEKLSKRHGAVSLFQYADDGYLPETMLNFLARLGWSHGDAEIFSREELIGWFDLHGISPSPARFDGVKLNWLNSEHIKRADRARLGQLLQRFLLERGCDPATGPDAAQVAELYRERAATLVEMAEAAHYLYHIPHIPDELSAQHLSPASRDLLRLLIPRLATLDWKRETIGAALKAFAAEQGIKMPQIMMAVRVAVSGSASTPAVDAVLAVLGRQSTLERLGAATGE